MHKNNQRASSWRFLIPAFSLVILLSLTIAACGNNATTTVGSSVSVSTTGVTPTPTSTTTGVATQSGCPNKSQITTMPPAASVVLKNPNNTQPVDVKKGSSVEIDLPSTSSWTGPAGPSATLMTVQQPSGFTSTQSKVCVWRFVASNTGMATLTFTGRPICTAGVACPQYVTTVSFLIDIK